MKIDGVVFRLGQRVADEKLIAIAEAPAEIVPHVRVQPAAVDEHDGVPAFAAPVEVVQAQSVALDVAAERRSLAVVQTGSFHELRAMPYR